ATLRAEILRARDEAQGARTTAEVQADRVVELEGELHALGAVIDELGTEIRAPLVRVARAIQRRLPGSRR
ncbi:MAG: hypothetical protein ACKVIY_16440, partial [Acidimicrobiales bacterium]